MRKFLQLPEKGGDPKPFYFILAGGILLVVMAITLAAGGNEREALEERQAELESTIASHDRSILDKEAAQAGAKNEAIVEVTGLDPQVIESDTESARAYFSKAFNWSSGADYDKARAEYDETLGKGNSFTKSYMPENTKIETNSGDLSYIDFKKLKSKMDDIFIVPITSEGERVRYAAFVRYFMHTDEQDLNNLSALAPSDAIIEFTVAGNEGKRAVSEVDAWSGFNATLE